MLAEAHILRRNEDVAKLAVLQRDLKNAMAIVGRYGEPTDRVELEIRIPTAGSRKYPDQRQTTTRVTIELPLRYPFEPPKVTVTTPIWNPNIFPSGLVCLGQKWIPSHSLALLAQRILQIIALDPSIINLASPANADAARWYANLASLGRSIFPTVDLDKLRAPPPPKIGWKQIK